MNDKDRLNQIHEDNRAYLKLRGDNPNYQNEYSMQMNRTIEFLLGIIDDLNAEQEKKIWPFDQGVAERHAKKIVGDYYRVAIQSYRIEEREMEFAISAFLRAISVVYRPRLETAEIEIAEPPK